MGSNRANPHAQKDQDLTMALPDSHLSPHFTKAEFACHCCGRVAVDPSLIQGLEALRELIDAPIVVLSGCRCVQENSRVGGTAHSQHLVSDHPEEGGPCRAADIYVSGRTAEDLLGLAGRISLFRQGGIGYYPSENFVHVDTRTNGPARWARLKHRGPYVAIPEKILKGAGL